MSRHIAPVTELMLGCQILVMKRTWERTVWHAIRPGMLTKRKCAQFLKVRQTLSNWKTFEIFFSKTENIDIHKRAADKNKNPNYNKVQPNVPLINFGRTRHSFKGQKTKEATRESYLWRVERVCFWDFDFKMISATYRREIKGWQWQIIRHSVVCRSTRCAGEWGYLHTVCLGDRLSPPSALWSCRPPSPLWSGFYSSVGDNKCENISCFVECEIWDHSCLTTWRQTGGNHSGGNHRDFCWETTSPFSYFRYHAF